MSADELVWKALASPHRRELLDLLGGGPRTTGELDALTDLGRYSVMQHLRVLEQAGLVVVRREGRHRYNHLNPVPIRQVYERWVSGLAGQGAKAALSLKRHVEDKRPVEQGGTTMPTQRIHIENEIRIEASPETVWKAMTTEQAEWYPHSYGEARMKRIVFEERVSGAVFEDWGDGAGHMYGHVMHYDPPRSLGMRSFLYGAITLEQWTQLEPDGDATVLKHSMFAFGDISDEMAASIHSHGDLKGYETELKAWCERRERVNA